MEQRSMTKLTGGEIVKGILFGLAGLLFLGGCTASQKAIKANSSAIHGIRTHMGKTAVKVSNNATQVATNTSKISDLKDRTYFADLAYRVSELEAWIKKHGPTWATPKTRKK